MEGGSHAARPGPYIGPRAFRTGERLYGRDREAQDLLDLLISERVVLLHSPSGAGKSSLLQAALLPRLAAEGFTVLPPARVSHDPPATSSPANRYTLSVLIDLGEDPTLPELAALPLADALQRRRARDGADELVLILDQFEEVLTVDPVDHAGKLGFFQQLGAALRDPRLWLLVALREDYLAALAPYRGLLPTRLKSTFRLDLLGPAAALRAIQEPARAAGVTFADPAAHKLVDDLRLVKVPRAGGVALEPGPHVEPVQLQVVCKSLWDRLPAGQARIELADLERLGDVDQALAAYCDDALAAAARTGVRERTLRAWVQRHLVTDAGLRSQILLAPGPDAATHGLPNRALASLVDAHMLRSDERRGIIWVELAHDRLVAPLVASNAAWFRGHLSPVQRQAELWDGQGRRDDLLLADRREIQRQLASDDLTAIEREFLARSRIVRQRERKNRLLRRILIVMLVFGLIAVAVLAEIRRRAEAVALAARDRADTATRQAVVRQLAAESALQPLGRADTAARMSLAASALAPTPGERSATLVDHWARFPLLARLHRLGPAQALAFDRAGQRAISLDDRPQVHLWDLASDAPQGPAGALASAVAIAPDGSFAAWSDARGIGADITVWDLAGARVRATLPRPEGYVGAVESLQISGDGQRLLARSQLGALVVWQLAPPTPLALFLSDPDNIITAAALHPDGERLALGDRAGKLELTNLRDDPLAADTSIARSIVGLQFTPDGARLFATYHPTRRLAEWHIAADNTLELVRADVLGSDTVPASLHFSPDLRRVAGRHCGEPCSLHELGLWDLADGRLLASEALPPESLARAPAFVDATRVALGSGDGSVRVWDPARRPMLTLPRLAAVAVHPGGLQVATGGCDRFTRPAEACAAGQVRLWDARSGEPLGAPLTAADQVIALHFTGDGQRLQAIDRQGQVLTWDLASRAATPAPAIPRPDRRMQLADDLVALADDTTLTLHDLNTGRDRDLAFPTRGPIAALTLAPDAATVAAAACSDPACTTTELLVWRTSDAAVLHRLPAGPVTRLDLAADNHQLAAASRDASVQVWDLTTGTSFTLVPEFDPLAPTDLRFSPDGQQLATIACRAPDCSTSATVVHLWSLAERRPRIAPITGHSELYPPHPGQRPQVHLAGELLLTTSHDGVRVWDLGEPSLRARVCALARRGFTPDEWTRYLGPTLAFIATCEPAP